MKTDRLIDRLVLECEDEILNTTDVSFDRKMAMCKNNSLVDFILLSYALIAISGCLY